MRRLAAVTAIVFVLVLAFLAGRVRAGADPAQTSAPAAAQAQPGPDPGFATPGYGAPGDSVSPYGGGSDPNPPVTHAS